MCQHDSFRSVQIRSDEHTLFYQTINSMFMLPDWVVGWEWWADPESEVKKTVRDYCWSTESCYWTHTATLKHTHTHLSESWHNHYHLIMCVCVCVQYLSSVSGWWVKWTLSLSSAAEHHSYEGILHQTLTHCIINTHRHTQVVRKILHLIFYPINLTQNFEYILKVKCVVMVKQTEEQKSCLHSSLLIEAEQRLTEWKSNISLNILHSLEVLTAEVLDAQTLQECSGSERQERSETLAKLFCNDAVVRQSVQSQLSQHVQNNRTGLAAPPHWLTQRETQTQVWQKIWRHS